MFITPVAAVDDNPSASNLVPSSTHDIMIDAISWKSYAVTCSMGDTLSGEFRLVSSGELFPGDQTQYDIWILEGIDFLILDEENYDLWIEDSAFSSILQKDSIIELEWSIEIPHAGVWYVVYINDSLYSHQVEGSIIRTGPYDTLVLLTVFLGVALLLTLTVFYFRER